MQRQSRFLEPSILFALPVLGVCLVIGAVDLIVPRDRAANILAAIDKSVPVFGADAIAALYYLALGYFLNFVACLISIGWCLWVIHRQYDELNLDERPYFLLGLALAVASPMLILAIRIFYPGCGVLAVDDCVTSMLFAYSIRKVYLAHFVFTLDADVFSYFVFTAYLIAASTVTLIARTRTAVSDNLWSGTKKNEERMRTLNTVLFLVAAVLITSMLASRLRYDVGLATLGAPHTATSPNLPFVAYQTLASAKMAFGASILSVWLALIYLPAALVLTFSSASNTTIVLSYLIRPNQENFMRLLKLVAIFSPPIINKIIELMSAAPKGV